MQLVIGRSEWDVKIERKLFLFFLIFVLMLNLASARPGSFITRTFSDDFLFSGQILTVSLDVFVNEGETYYAVDEKVPQGWTIIDSTQSGYIDNENYRVKWAVLMGAGTTIYEYTVQIPNDASGEYSFDGFYMFEGDEEKRYMEGDKVINIEESNTDNPTDTNTSQEEQPTNEDVEESTLTRSFSDNTPEQCSELTVSLELDVNNVDTYYAIDEIIPSGWEISDSGEGDTSESGHIKWVIVDGAENGNYQYKVDVPCDALGIYVFDGMYMFESDTEEQVIQGEEEINVQIKNEKSNTGGSNGGSRKSNCKESWSCNEWNECSEDGIISRTCTDKNNCGTTNEKPVEVQLCNYVPSKEEASKEEKDIKIDVKTSSEVDEEESRATKTNKITGSAIKSFNTASNIIIGVIVVFVVVILGISLWGLFKIMK